MVIKMVKRGIRHCLLLFMSLSVICIIITLNASATTVKSIETDKTTNIVTIKGQLDYKIKGIMVTFEVFTLESSGGSKTPNIENLMNHLVYFDQTLTDAEGNYEFQFGINGISSVFNIRIGWTENGFGDGFEFEYINPFDLENAINIINSSKNETEQMAIKKILDAIKKYKTALQLDLSLFEKLSDKNAVCKGIWTVLKAEGDFEYGDFIDVLNQEIVIEAIVEAKSTGEIVELIENYHAVLSLDDNSAYGLYGTLLNETAINKVGTSLLEKDSFKGVRGFIDEFQNLVILNAFRYVVSWSDVGQIIENANDILSMDLSTFNLLKNKNVVYKAMAGQTYTSLAEITGEFSRIVTNQYNFEIKPSPGSVGDNGGGGNSRYINISNPTDTSGDESPVSEAAYDLGFIDLPDDEWAKECIEVLVSKGIVNGRSKNLFEPDSYITRAEFVKMLVLAFEFNIDNELVSFHDVKSDSWAYPYISTAYNAGIIKGMGDGSFGADSNITRQDMAVLAYRTASYMGVKMENGEGSSINFVDMDKFDEYAVDAINIMKNNNIINGVGENKFAPLEKSTRAHAAKIIYELMKHSTSVSIGKGDKS